MSKYSNACLLILCFGSMACKSPETKKEETNLPPQLTAGSISSLESSLKQDSLNIGLRTQLGSKYYAAGEFGKATYQFSKLYQQDNKNLIAITSLGNINYDSHQDDQAIAYYEKSLALDPANLDVRCDLATCYSNINKMKKAILILEENIRMNPAHRKSHYNLSVILQKKGSVKEARREMNFYDSLTGVSKK